MDLIDEKYSWYKLSNTVINVLVDDFVDFKSKLFGDLSFLWSVDLTHKGEKVMTTLRASVSGVQIMKSNVLNDFLLFVDITLWDRDIFLSLEIVLSCISIRTTDSLDGATSGFDIDNITNCDLLLLNVLIDAWVELELLLALGGLQTDND